MKYITILIVILVAIFQLDGQNADQSSNAVVSLLVGTNYNWSGSKVGTNIAAVVQPGTEVPALAVGTNGLTYAASLAPTVSSNSIIVTNLGSTLSVGFTTNVLGVPTVQTNLGSGFVTGVGTGVTLAAGSDNRHGMIILTQGGTASNPLVPLVTLTYSQPYQFTVWPIIVQADGTNIPSNNPYQIISNGLGGFMIAARVSIASAQTVHWIYNVP
jgi:hypothetical protein